MSYVQDGAIEATDFNIFKGQADPVYAVGFGDSGYGQTALTIPTVVGGFIELVKSLEWTALQNVVDICADHQGTAKTLLPPVTVLEPEDVITAHDGITDAFDIPQMLTDVTANRLLSDPSSTSTFFSRHSDSVTTSWNSQLITEVQIQFATADEARYFFNSGGQIMFRLARSGGSATSQNTAWTDLLSSIGTIVMDYSATTSTGSGTGSSLGYYDLLDGVYQDIFTASVATGSYAGNNLRVRAQVLNIDGTNGDNGRTIRFEVQWNDTFTGPSDIVDGTIDFDIDERRATTFLTIASFTVGVIVPLGSTAALNPVIIDEESVEHISSTDSTLHEYVSVAVGSTAGRTALVTVTLEDAEGSDFTISSVVLDPVGQAIALTERVTEIGVGTGAEDDRYMRVSIWTGAIPDSLTGDIFVHVTSSQAVDSAAMDLVALLNLQSEIPTHSGTSNTPNPTTTNTTPPVGGNTDGIIVGVSGSSVQQALVTWSSITKRSLVSTGSGTSDHRHGAAWDLLPIGRVASAETVTYDANSNANALVVAAFR